MAKERILSKRVVVGLSAAFVPGLVLSAPPVAYDDWTVTAGGTIDSTVSCSGANVVSCTTIVADTGMLYEEVETTDYSYLRLILTEPSASGDPSTLDFTTETFIPFAEEGSGIKQGLASKQVIRDTTANFVATAEIQRSDLRVNSLLPEDTFNVKLSQSITDLDMTADFNYRNYTQYPAWYVPSSASPDSNDVMGEKLDIAQNVQVGEPGDATKKQVYDYRKRSGNEGYSPSAWWGVRDPITTAGSQTLDGTAVTWTDGQELTSLWIGQSSNVEPAPGLEVADVAMAFQRVENLSSGASAEELVFDVPEPLSPFSWDATNFGTAPVFP